MAHEQASLVRQGQNLLDAVVKRRRIAAGEVCARRPAIRHEQRVADKGGIPHHMHHAGRCMARCVDGNSLHVAHVIGVAILEQGVKLASIALEFGPFVEDLAEGFLHDQDLLAYPDLAAQSLLDIGRCRQMVRMDMGFDDPLELEVVLPDMLDNRVGMIIGDPARRVIDVHYRVDDSAGTRGRVFDHVADGIGCRIEESLNLGLTEMSIG